MSPEDVTYTLPTGGSLPPYGSPPTIEWAEPPLDPVRAHALYCSVLSVMGVSSPTAHPIETILARAGAFEDHLRGPR